MDFLDRERELEILRDFEGIALIYGRRRIGKTALARKAMPNALYVNGFVDSLEEIAEELSVESSWTSIILKARKVIIDEFQEFDNLTKELAYAYDLLSQTGTEFSVILVTSYISKGKLIQSEGSPLFGRISRRILLKQIPRKYVVDKYGLDFYLIFGGTPQYIAWGEEFGVEGLIDENSALYNELEYLLDYEFKSRAYVEVIRSIRKRPRPLDKSLEYHAKRLEEADVVRRVYRGKSKLWELSDNFFRTRMAIDKARRPTNKEARKEILNRILPTILDENFEAMFRDLRTWYKRNPKRILYPLGLSIEIDAVVELEDRSLVVEVKRRVAKEEDCSQLMRKVGMLESKLKRRLEPVIVSLGGKTSCETLTLDDFR